MPTMTAAAHAPHTVPYKPPMTSRLDTVPYLPGTSNGPCCIGNVTEELRVEFVRQPERRPAQAAWYVVLTLALGGIAVVLTMGILRPITVVPVVHEVGPASSCAEGSWPATEISCKAAENRSVTGIISAPGPWTAAIWLTTLAAVDSRLNPPRQVADHPTSGDVPVWLFIYENPEGARILHVAAAADAKPGAFVYIYRWWELGSPDMPTMMPAVP